MFEYCAPCEYLDTFDDRVDGNTCQPPLQARSSSLNGHDFLHDGLVCVISGSTGDQIVVEIDGRITMTGNQQQLCADGQVVQLLSRTLHYAVLVATSAVGEAASVYRRVIPTRSRVIPCIQDGDPCTTRMHCLVACIYYQPVRMGARVAHDSRQHEQCVVIVRVVAGLGFAIFPSRSWPSISALLRAYV